MLWIVSLTFIYRRMNGASGSVCVEYHTDDMSALAGEHYTSTNGQLVFDVGEIIKYIEVDSRIGSTKTELTHHTSPLVYVTHRFR